MQFTPPLARPCLPGAWRKPFKAAISQGLRILLSCIVRQPQGPSLGPCTNVPLLCSKSEVRCGIVVNSVRSWAHTDQFLLHCMQELLLPCRKAQTRFCRTQYHKCKSTNCSLQLDLARTAMCEIAGSTPLAWTALKTQHRHAQTKLVGHEALHDDLCRAGILYYHQLERLKGGKPGRAGCPQAPTSDERSPDERSLTSDKFHVRPTTRRRSFGQVFCKPAQPSHR